MVLAASRKAAVKATELTYTVSPSACIRTSSNTKASWINLISVIKTGNCPSLRQNRGRAAWPISVSLRKGAGERANGSLHLIQERVRKRIPQSICSRDTSKSVPSTGLGKQKVRTSLLQQSSDQTGSDLS